MRVFVINLDKDQEKLKVVDSRLQALSVSYQRVSGVYGKAMSRTEKRSSVNRFRWWCAIGRSIADAEIGCALSHYKIYRQMKDAPVCVLEDDVVLDNRFKEVLDFVERNIDVARPQVVLLSDHTSMYEGVDGMTTELKSSTCGICTEAYVITPKAAQALLHANQPMVVPCDHWGRWVKCGLIELFHALPTVARQDQVTFLSSTSSGRRAVADYHLNEKVWHYICRGVGKVFDLVFQKLFGR